jgi:hypothetical protein
MFARVVGWAVLGLALAAFGVGSAGDKGAKDGKKDKTETKSVTGLIKSIDAAKGSFTITLLEGKERMFLVDDSTKFVGPKGGSRGMGKAGLKDDTMVKGNEVRVVPGPGDKTALEVHLPQRKGDGKDKKDGK